MKKSLRSTRNRKKRVNLRALSGCCASSTGNDRTGHGYSGIDRYSRTKNPDDAILFTVSGITAIVEQKIRKFQLEVIKDPFYFQKIRSITIFSFWSKGHCMAL